MRATRPLPRSVPVELCAAAAALPDGLTVVQATAIDATGVTATTQPYAFSIASALPDTDTPVILTPIEDGQGNDDRPVITGLAADDGATVRVASGTAMLCSAVVTAYAWHCQVSTALPHGPSAIHATATIAGVTSAPSADRNFTIDPTIASVVPPVLTAPAPGSSTTNSRPMFSGTGALFGIVKVLDGSGAMVCDADVAVSAAWSCVPPTAMPDGSTTVTAVAVDAFGNVSAPSAPVTFTITDPGTVFDTDGDGIDDSIDIDDDGDGISDIAEGNGGVDTDDDGIPDSLDADSDNDGLTDLAEGVTDADGDGVVDALDTTAIVDLQVSSAGGSSTAGVNTTFEATVVNNGPSIAPSGLLVLVLPAELSPVSAAFTSVGSFVLSAGVTVPTCAISGQTITCDRPALAVHNGATFRIVAKVAASAAPGATLTVDATVTVLGDAFDKGQAAGGSSIVLRALTSQLPATL
jgi:Domain of unknown function DUF11/Bacterial Ig-like domain